jgi:serine/threonine protein kinase
VPVLGGFGICYVKDGALVTLSDEGVGSENFIAPEMESGASGDASGATDLYSLATKVLYWMIFGGKHLAREDHRAGSCNLARSPDRQRFEHVHMFLDKFSLADPRKRCTLSDFRRDLERLVTLVEGDFVPLEPGLRIQCRFCGLGTYERSNAAGISLGSRFLKPEFTEWRVRML